MANTPLAYFGILAALLVLIFWTAFTNLSLTGGTATFDPNEVIGIVILLALVGVVALRKKGR